MKKAIRSAHANGFIHNEAVAYEVAARFYAARGFDKIADAYLHEARYCYLRWGADGKVRQLDELYPHLRKEEPTRGTSSTIVAFGRTPGSSDRNQSLPSSLGRDGSGKTDRENHARGHRARGR